MSNDGGSSPAGSGGHASGSAGGPVVAVCFDAVSAASVIHEGGIVVLCGTDGEALAAAAAALRPSGRIGVLVGNPAADQVQVAACAMARELFGQEPVLHRPATG